MELEHVDIVELWYIERVLELYGEKVPALA